MHLDPITLNAKRSNRWDRISVTSDTKLLETKFSMSLATGIAKDKGLTGFRATGPSVTLVEIEQRIKADGEIKTLDPYLIGEGKGIKGNIYEIQVESGLATVGISREFELKAAGGGVGIVHTLKPKLGAKVFDVSIKEQTSNSLKVHVKVGEDFAYLLGKYGVGLEAKMDVNMNTTINIKW